MHVGQAVKRIDLALEETFATVRPHLKWRDGPAKMNERRNSFTNTADGEVSVGRTRYVRTSLSKAKLAELAERVEKHWRAVGYKIGDVHSSEPAFSGTASDGCIIKFAVGGSGNVYFYAGVGAISPGYGGEVEGEEGDRFPKAPNGGPDYTPDVRDPYWSK